MFKIQNPKQYDLEERTFRFARDCRDFIKQAPGRISNFEYTKQLIRSSGSQAANYIEANESVSKKDFSHRIRICRKEAKESRLWLRLLETAEGEGQRIQLALIQESIELTKIFAAILDKSRSF